MRFARTVFVLAGIWGIVVLTPFYWLADVTARRYDPPTEYPHFFYGFVGVALAWQIAFLVIGSNPARCRPFMIPATLEKFGYVATLAVLYGQGRIAAVDAFAAVPDGLLGLLFILAFVKTRPAARDQAMRTPELVISAEPAPGEVQQPENRLLSRSPAPAANVQPTVTSRS